MVSGEHMQKAAAAKRSSLQRNILSRIRHHAKEEKYEKGEEYSVSHGSSSSNSPFSIASIGVVAGVIILVVFIFVLLEFLGVFTFF